MNSTHMIKGPSMFSFLKFNPIKKLDKEYGVLLEKAMQAQRGGDIKRYSELTEQAEAVKAKIDEAKSA
ncbi:hypothetical protein MSP8887_01465 [Marinomonas spartinae]|uniref:Lacal_2735 family protein n=2 Tax=Marinomonas spartinae TaxID=1792290 RepID=A0A1A8TPC6_9GAMM|nr:hypothetical protein MSP8887_01465 [Marinomonas spartinae]SBS36072.1 hypothetical protein MSP8886_03567 [Marinomonas spartinae]